MPGLRPERWRCRHGLTVLLCLALAACGSPAPDYREATIADLHDAMNRGELTSEQLVNWYLDRIEAIDRGGPTLNSVIELNPDALAIARALDDDWRAAVQTAGLAGLTPHGARHDFATLLRQAGYDLKALQDFGGWKSINSVARSSARTSPSMSAPRSKR